MMLHLLADVQKMRKHHLRYGVGAIGRNIGNNHSPCLGCFRIYDIKACGQYADVAQVRQGVDGISVEHGLVGQEDFSSP